MRKITNIIANKLLIEIDHTMQDTISDDIIEQTKTNLETHVFTRFEDIASNSFDMWTQLLDNIEYDKH